MRLTDNEQAMRDGASGPAVQWAIEHQIKVGSLSRRRGFRPGRAGPHHGRHRVAWPRRRRMAGALGQAAGKAAPRAHPDHHRSARHRFRLRAQAQASAVDARPGAPRHRGVRGDGRAEHQHLHQLPDHHAAGARRALRLWRHRRGDLLQQRVRRALELRGRAVGAERGPDRAHAALRLSPRRAPAGDARGANELHAARAERMGRARRHRRALGGRLLAGAGGGRDRPHAHVGRDEAFRRGGGELRLARAVSHDRHHAGGAADGGRAAARRSADA